MSRQKLEKSRGGHKLWRLKLGSANHFTSSCATLVGASGCLRPSVNDQIWRAHAITRLSRTSRVCIHRCSYPLYALPFQRSKSSAWRTTLISHPRYSTATHRLQCVSKMASSDHERASGTNTQVTDQSTRPDRPDSDEAPTNPDCWPRRTEPTTKLSSEDNIRLLRVESISDDSVACSLWECPLSFATHRVERYYALSYCWGDEQRHREISINGKPFAVTPNLFKVLQAAYRYHETPNVTVRWFWSVHLPMVWADAICLNQDDDAEKSVQVQRMDEIYSGADRVLVWLGDDSDNSQLVIWVLRWMEGNHILQNARNIEKEESIKIENDLKIWAGPLLKHYEVDQNCLNAFHKLYMALLRYEKYEYWFMSRDECSEIVASSCNREDLFPPDSPFWSAFLPLMNHPWFMRVWTRQETRLARRATVLCGSCVVDYTTFEYARLHLFWIGWHDI